MIATGVFVDDGASPELTHHHDEGAVEEASRFQVFYQSKHGLVDSWRERLEAFFDSAPADFVAVVIEVAPGSADQNERHTGLDQSSRQQRFLADAVSSVQIAR